MKKLGILGIVLAVLLTIGGLIGYVVSAKFAAERFEQSIVSTFLQKVIPLAKQIEVVSEQ